MAIKIQNTMHYIPVGVKLLVYGEPGVGKTPLSLTANNAFLVASDPGLMTIRGQNMPYCATQTRKDILDAHAWVMSSNEARQYETICVDSISEHGEIILAHHESNNKDFRRAFQLYMNDVYKMVRDYIYISNKNFYVTAKRTKVEIIQETKVLGNPQFMYYPTMSSEKSQDWLVHKFDHILALREAKTQGIKYNYLQTKGVDNYKVRDRSGILDPIEEPNLQKIINKIKGV